MDDENSIPGNKAIQASSWAKCTERIISWEGDGPSDRQGNPRLLRKLKIHYSARVKKVPQHWCRGFKCSGTWCCSPSTLQG